MSDKSKAKLLFERWTVSIKREDRRHEKMPELFDDLVMQLFTAGIEFELAHETAKAASKYMYPSIDVIKHVYNKSSAKKFQTMQEFIKSWQDSLDKSALTAFYNYYSIEDDPLLKKTNKESKSVGHGMVTEDELNQQDFWKSVKGVSKEKPWLFNDEDQKDD